MCLLSARRRFQWKTALFTVFAALAYVGLSPVSAFAQQHLSPRAPQQTAHSLHLVFDGDQPKPLAMVSGDFDEDGVQDLAISYGQTKGGSILLLHGNLDALAPQTRESWEAVGQHQYSDPYLQRSKPVSVASQPDLMIAADVNGDGHLDVVYATRGSSQLNVMLGDGKGNFGVPVSTSVAGGLTALAAYRPGPPLFGEAIVAAYQSRTGAKLSLLSYSDTALVARAAYPLPGPATTMTVANLDADLIPDTAIVAGGKLLILHGKTALSGRGSLTTVPISGAESVTAGEFLFDRHAQLQLSVLTTGGDVVILAHNGFDPRPYTPQQIAETRQRDNSTLSLAQQAGNNGSEPWVEVETNSGAGAFPTGERTPILLRSRASGSGGDDLVVLNPSQRQSTVISHTLVSSGNAVAATPSHVTTSNMTSDDVIAAISTQVTPDASQGLVLLHAGNISPDITLPSAGNTFYVNTTADNSGTTTDPSDGLRCTQGSGEICTLRDAITFINNDASDNISAHKSDTIMVPAGTYTLTWQRGTTDTNTNALTHLEILGPVIIIGDTSGGGTIINANNNDTVFTINPGPFGSFNPSGDSYVFNTTLENLVIEGGENTNNLNNNGLANYVGGCMNWDAFGTGNLTLTNTTVKNCIALWGPGGGIWAQNSAGGGTGTLTISGSTISNNSTPEIGGGIDEASPPSAFSISNTTITGNKAQISVNPSDGDADGSGGGLFVEGRQPPPATPQSSLTGVTITSNVAANDNGGGIATFTGLLISGSVIKSNSTGGSGGGVWSNTAGDGSSTVITSSNLLSNSAAATGGAIALGIESQASGNILQVSLSRIVGNTATGGASGLANGVSGEGAGEAIATENWWGCNSGPTTASDGCDQAVLYNGAGSLTTAPFAKLGFSSNITTIPPSGSMVLTVSLNSDSNNNAITGAFPAVATNYPYTFQVTGVTANPALTTGTFNTSGVGSATLTPSTTGNGTVTVTFDNQTDSINFTAQGATATSLSITAVPSTSFLYGQPSSFTVQLTPTNATGISASDFAVTLDGASMLDGSSFGVTLVSGTEYQVTGPFNLVGPGNHTLAVSFAATGYVSSSQMATLTVGLGAASVGGVVSPTNPIQGVGGSVLVTVTPVGTGATPTGTVTYAFDGGSPSSVPLSSGTASITIPATVTAGSHSLALTYNGDSNYGTATHTVAFTVYGRSQTTIASITSTTATIDVVGFGFTAPSGQLAFTDTTSGTPVSAPVTLNTATATTALTPQVTTSTGANSLPDWTTLGDVNGDGKLDMVASVYNTNSVSVQLGNGDGTFQAATTTLIAAGFGPAENHLVSLRGNGTLDLIVGSFNTNQIAVLLGNGNGTFQAPVFYTVGSAGNPPTSLTTGDFNHDGDLDVAVANTGNNSISILLGNGSGALTTFGSPIAVGREPEAIRAGDFNGDGFSDLAVANYRDGTVTTLLNNQNGTFTATTISVGSGAGSGPQALAMIGSGSSLQLAVANYLDNTVSVLKSNGDGTFGTQTIVHVGRGPDDLSFADFNGDGVEDLVVSNYLDGSVDLLLGSSGGSYTLTGPFTIGNNPYSAAVGDLDGDGTPDLVVSNCTSNNTGVLRTGTQISVPYNGLGLVPGDTLHAAYTPDGTSKYGPSTSAGVTAP
jgi:CSLREA domain-containing protein